MIISSSSRVTADVLSRIYIHPFRQQAHRTLASDAYFPPRSLPPPSTTPNSSANGETIAPKERNAATTETPADLTPAQKELVARIIRVDQAGEVGANWIYRGQKMAMALRGDTKSVKQIEVSGTMSPLSRSRILGMVGD